MRDNKNWTPLVQIGLVIISALVTLLTTKATMESEIAHLRDNQVTLVTRLETINKEVTDVNKRVARIEGHLKKEFGD